MHPLEERLLKLEKNIKMYRFLFATVICGALAFVLMSNDQKAVVPAKIQAKAIEVVDDYGNVLVSLGKEDENGAITTYTKSGKKLTSFFTSDGGGGGINTFDADGQVNFKVTRTTDGGGYLALFNGDRKEIFEAGSTTANSGYFRVNDRYGEKLAWLTFTEGGGGYFSLMGKNNKELIKLSTPDAGGRIGVYNGNEKRIGFFGTQDNKDGNLTIYGSDGARTGSVPNY
jgi:hypothetical protein